MRTSSCLCQGWLRHPASKTDDDFRLHSGDRLCTARPVMAHTRRSAGPRQLWLGVWPNSFVHAPTDKWQVWAVVWLLCNCGGQRRKDRRGKLPLPASPSSGGRARMAVSRLAFSNALSECVPLSVSLSYGRVMLREPSGCQNVCRCQPVLWAYYGTGTQSLSECVPLSYGRIYVDVLWYGNPRDHTQ